MQLRCTLCWSKAWQKKTRLSRHRKMLPFRIFCYDHQILPLLYIWLSNISEINSIMKSLIFGSFHNICNLSRLLNLSFKKVKLYQFQLSHIPRKLFCYWCCGCGCCGFLVVVFNGAVLGLLVGVGVIVIVRILKKIFQ